jgi:hypothetical protein
LYTGEGRKIDLWILMGVRRNNEPGIFVIYRKEEYLSHLLICEGTKMWRDEILDRRFKNIKVEICIRRKAVCKNIEQWQK